jgi:hypothetical protein
VRENHITKKKKTHEEEQGGLKNILQNGTSGEHLRTDPKMKNREEILIRIEF